MIFTSSSAIRILYFNLPHPSFTLIIFEKPKYVKKLTLIFVKVIFCAKTAYLCQLCGFSALFELFEKFLMFMFFKVEYRNNKGASGKVWTNERSDRYENCFAVP